MGAFIGLSFFLLMNRRFVVRRTIIRFFRKMGYIFEESIFRTFLILNKLEIPVAGLNLSPGIK